MKIINLLFLVTLSFVNSLYSNAICAPNDRLFSFKKINIHDDVDEIVEIKGTRFNNRNRAFMRCKTKQPYYNVNPAKYRDRRKSLTTLGQGTTLTLLARGAAAPTGRIVGLEGAIDIVQ